MERGDRGVGSEAFDTRGVSDGGSERSALVKFPLTALAERTVSKYCVLFPVTGSTAEPMLKPWKRGIASESSPNLQTLAEAHNI